MYIYIWESVKCKMSILRVIIGTYCNGIDSVIGSNFICADVFKQRCRNCEILINDQNECDSNYFEENLLRFLSSANALPEREPF